MPCFIDVVSYDISLHVDYTVCLDVLRLRNNVFSYAFKYVVNLTMIDAGFNIYSKSVFKDGYLAGGTHRDISYFGIDSVNSDCILKPAWKRDVSIDFYW